MRVRIRGFLQKRLALALAVCLSAFLFGCEGATPTAADVLVIETPQAAPATRAPTVIPATPPPAPTPTATPEPVSTYAVIGAVGDIMMMQSQVQGGWDKSAGAYDFSPSFAAMQPWFQNADMLCANLETPLAGEAAGYSGPAPAKPTPDAEGNPVKGSFQTFNAPDALAFSLLKSGFTALTTANNHCLDRGVPGLYRTAQVARGAGLVQVGTYLDQEDRDTPRIAEINGIRVGLLAWTESVNSNDGMLGGEERKFAVGRTRDRDRMRKDIELCLADGAEYIVALIHWDDEFFEAPKQRTRDLAKWLLEQGVDAIFGSHPHVVQPVEYRTVERNGDAYTGLVVYSMGNFLSNMAPSPKDYGLYVELTLEKTPTGEVRLFDAGMLPTYCIKHRVGGRVLHEVLPACADPADIPAAEEVKEANRVGLAAARAHVLRVCGGALRAIA